MIASRPKLEAPARVRSSVWRGSLVGAIVCAGVLAGAADAGARPGDLDPSFSRDGTLAYGAAVAKDVEVLADGRVLVLGSGRGGVEVRAFSNRGRLDRTFAEGGVARIDLGPGEYDYGLALNALPDGDLLVVGQSHPYLAAARLDPDGRLDPSFGDGGVINHALARPISPHSVAVGPDGDILVGAWLYAPEPEDEFSVVIRMSSDGRLDTGFAGDGVAEPALVWRDFTVAVDSASRVLLSANARLSQSSTTSEPALLRILPDGTPDPAFGGDGRISIPALSAVADGAPVLGEGGDIFVLGYGGGDGLSVAHLTADGDPMPFATPTGLGSTQLDASGDIFYGGPWLGVDDAGRPVVTGTVPEVEDFGVARLLADGSTDPDFGTRGQVQTPFGGCVCFYSNYPAAADFAPGRRLVVVGVYDANYATAVARYKLAGNPARGDRDADGYEDRRDACPLLSDRRKRGCPRYPTTVTIDYTGRKFRGHAKGAGDVCLERDRLVRLYRSQAGKDALIGRAESDLSGFWEINALNRKGRFYAVVERAYEPESGVCKQATSETIRVGPSR